MPRIDQPLKYLAVLDADWRPEALSAAKSSYTETDPRPGTATTSVAYPKLDPAVVGAQADGVVLAVLQSGFPKGGGQGLGVGYYLNDGIETISDARGFQAPIFFSDWRYAVNTYPGVAYCPLDGRIVLGVTLVFDHWTDSFTTMTSPGVDLSEAYALHFVPGTDRLLLMTARATYLSDNLSTYTLVSSDGPITVSSGSPTYSSTSGKTRAGSDSFGNLLWVAQDTASPRTTDFYASDDGGASWREVERWEIDGSLVGDVAIWDCATHPDGYVVFVYWDYTDSTVYFVRLASAFDAPSSQGKQDTGIGTRPADGGLSIAVDSNGSIRLFVAENAAPPARTYCYSSNDNGVTWTTLDNLTGRGNTLRLKELQLVPHPHGGLAGVASWTSGTVITRGYVQLGGWSGPGRDGNDWGVVDGTRNDVQWIGHEEPTEDGFTKTGASTDTLVTAGTAPSGYWRVEAGGGGAAGYWTISIHTDDRKQAAAEGIVRIAEDSGTNAAISSGIGLRLQTLHAADNVRYTLELRMDEGGWRLWDVEASAWESSKVVVDMTVRTHFRFSMDATGGSTIWEVQTRGDGETLWMRTTGSGFTSAATASSGASVVFGQLAGVVSAESHWWKVAARGVAAPGLVGTSNIGVGAVSYPLPDIHDTVRERLAWLRMRGGPAYTGEEYTIEPRYGYPIGATFSTREPSPDRRWRSTADAVEQTVMVDKGGNTDVGHSTVIALVALKVNVRYIDLLAEEDPSAGAVVLATMDLAQGFDAVTYTLSGNRVVPDATGTGARYIQRNELVGGHVVLDADGSGAGPHRARITGNSAGWWDSTADVRASLYVEAADIVGADASGDCVIVWPSGLLLHFITDTTVYRWWGWRIASTEETPTGYHEAGIISLMGCVGLGKAYANGWQVTEDPNVRVSEDGYGTQRRQQRGPTRRTFTCSWDHQVDLRTQRIGDGVVSDFLGPNDATPVVARDDVWHQLRGAVLDARGGELPVLLVTGEQAGLIDIELGSAVTVTSPADFVYGYLSSAVGFEHTLGDESTGELGRVRQLRIVEAV